MTVIIIMSSPSLPTTLSSLFSIYWRIPSHNTVIWKGIQLVCTSVNNDNCYCYYCYYVLLLLLLLLRLTIIETY